MVSKCWNSLSLSPTLSKCFRSRMSVSKGNCLLCTARGIIIIIITHLLSWLSFIGKLARARAQAVRILADSELCGSGKMLHVVKKIYCTFADECTGISVGWWLYLPASINRVYELIICWASPHSSIHTLYTYPWLWLCWLINFQTVWCLKRFIHFLKFCNRLHYTGKWFKQPVGIFLNKK